MGQVIASASMSLDGYIAKDDNTIGRLFDSVEAHPEAPFHFVTDGVDAAVAKAQAVAQERTVAVTAGTLAGQCLQLGLLDAVSIDLVPVVLGRGRPYFGELSLDDVALGDPTVCLQGDRVTHLLFPVREQSSEGRR